MDRYSHPKYFFYSQRPRPHRQITTCMFLNQRSASFIRRSVCRYIFNVAVDAAWDAEEAFLHRRRLITRPYKLNEKATLHSPIALIDLENDSIYVLPRCCFLFIYTNFIRLAQWSNNSSAAESRHTIAEKERILYRRWWCHFWALLCLSTCALILFKCDVTLQLPMALYSAAAAARAFVSWSPITTTIIIIISHIHCTLDLW